MSLFVGEWVQKIAFLLLAGLSSATLKKALKMFSRWQQLMRSPDPQRGGAGGSWRTRVSVVSRAQGMLPSVSFSTEMDFTSSSTQRTSEATCSARAS